MPRHAPHLGVVTFESVGLLGQPEVPHAHGAVIGTRCKRHVCEDGGQTTLARSRSIETSNPSIRDEEQHCFKARGLHGRCFGCVYDLPEGAKLRPRTTSLLAAKALSLVLPLCQYSTSPVSSAVSIQSPLWLHSIALTARAVPWRTFSKLNVIPYQNVNAPDAAPVTQREPSGVHCAVVASQQSNQQ
jgi:hypothetical protein